jgi:protein arginine N-methyltransferase 3
MALSTSNHHPEDLSDTSSASDPLDTRDDEGWEDVEQDEESVIVVSLFDDRTFPDAKEMLEYCRDNHGFDIWKLRQTFGDYGCRSNTSSS